MNLQHVINLWGSQAAFSRAIGGWKSNVGRWLNGDREMLEDHKLAVLRAAKKNAKLKTRLPEIAHMLDVQKCDCCGEVQNKEIRKILK